jgi:hypothetical protein
MEKVFHMPAYKLMDGTLLIIGNKEDPMKGLVARKIPRRIACPDTITRPKEMLPARPSKDVVSCSHSVNVNIPADAHGGIAKTSRVLHTILEVDLGPPSKRVKLTDDHQYALPDSKTLRQRLDLQIDHNESLEKKFKAKSVMLHRMRRKVSSMAEVITDLEGKNLVSQQAASHLSSLTENIPLELYDRFQSNQCEGNTSHAKYSPALRTFALTLSFISPSAYRYVRDTFSLALPHESVIRRWYM